jgi:hypothetical protein
MGISALLDNSHSNRNQGKGFHASIEGPVLPEMKEPKVFNLTQASLNWKMSHGNNPNGVYESRSSSQTKPSIVWRRTLDHRLPSPDRVRERQLRPGNSRRLSLFQEVQGEGECCAVCIEPFKTAEVLRILPCK